MESTANRTETLAFDCFFHKTTDAFFKISCRHMTLYCSIVLTARRYALCLYCIALYCTVPTSFGRRFLRSPHVTWRHVWNWVVFENTRQTFEGSSPENGAKVIKNTPSPGHTPLYHPSSTEPRPPADHFTHWEPAVNMYRLAKGLIMFQWSDYVARCKWSLVAMYFIRFA